MKTQKHRKTSDWAKTITLACACMCVSWVWEVSQSNAYSYQARTEIFYSIPLNLKSANLDLLNWFHNLPMSQKLHRKSATESPQKARRVIRGNIWVEEGQGHGGFTWPFLRNDGALAGSTGVLRLGRDLTAPRWGLSRACTQTLGGDWVGLGMSLLLSIPSQMDQRKAPQPGAPAWSPGRGPHCWRLEAAGLHLEPLVFCQ